MEASRTAVEVPEQVSDFMESRKTLTLATASAAGVPHAATLLYVSDGGTLYVWIRPQSATARCIEQNPVASFAIDEYSDEWRETRGIQGTGEVHTVLSGEEIARIAMLFGDKFPSLSPGASTIGISFCRIEPSELRFIDNSKSRQTGDEFGVDYHQDVVYSVLEELPRETASAIGARLQSLQVEADAVIARQGGPADKFFIVVNGEVELVREEDGATETVGRLGPGELFGELAILQDRPRATTVRAVKPTTLLAMERDAFRDLVAGSLGTTTDFDRILRERLGGGQER